MTFHEAGRDIPKGTLIASKYRILSKLGAGGMGEVYRAEDSSLNRQVAIKVLPDVFAADRERLARFQREAKVLASLNHPNIAAIYGVEESEGKRFLVLELVEGQTLAERLRKSPLPFEEALEICRQIAEGLEDAHEKGIVHRDLKPSNIKITPEGKVKILDFGLARAFLDKSPVGAIVDSPTITAEMTQPGIILGTATYMSPEQAKGKQVDKRTDIWAFGCILFECLTGKIVFPGETITEVLASVLKGEPDWEALSKDVPTNVRTVLGRCLQKDRNLRYHDVADARLELEETAPSTQLADTPLRRPPFRWVLTGIAVAILAGISADIALRGIFRPSPASRVVASLIQVEDEHWLAGNIPALGRPSRTAMAFSHDGRFVIYSAIPKDPKPTDKSRLFLRRLDQIQAKPIAGTEGASSPFLSPDDRLVGFWSEDRKLMRIPVEGGTPVALCDVLWCFGAAWGTSGDIVFANHENAGLLTLPAQGGGPQTLTVPDQAKGEYGHRLPAWLPNDAGILFTIVRYGHEIHPQVAVLSLPKKDKRVLIEDGADARYVPTGHLVFIRRGVLYAVPFDLSKLQVSGQPEPVVADIMQSLNTGNSTFSTLAAQFSFSDSGDIIFAKGGIVPDTQRSLVWVDFKGDFQEVVPSKAPFYAPRLSPSGRRIAYRRNGLKLGISVYNLDRDMDTPLISEGFTEWLTWTRDGNELSYSWTAAGPCNIFQQPADGSRPPRQITKSDYHQDAGSWSQDGKYLALVEEARPGTGMDILIWNVQEKQMVPFLSSKFNERYPEFSPTGPWLAYSSDESGRHEIYVRPFPGSGAKHQVSSQGGVEPLWSRNGKQIFYRVGGQVWVVDVMAEKEFQTGKPRMLFDKPEYINSSPLRNYDISLDGQRFLMVRVEGGQPSPATQIILVQNWFEELKRLVPAGKK